MNKVQRLIKKINDIDKPLTFWVWVILSLVAAYGLTLLFSHFKVLPSNLEDSEVGMISFLFTLPVTFAAAWVVVLLGKRMNELASDNNKLTERISNREHCRELYLICKSEYLKTREIILEVERALNKSTSFLKGKLLEVLLQPVMESALPADELKVLNADLGNEYQEEVRKVEEFNKCCDVGDKRPLPSWEAWERSSMVSEIARSIDGDCMDMRESLIKAISVILESDQTFLKSSECHQFEIRSAIAERKEELDRRLDDLSGIDLNANGLDGVKADKKEVEKNLKSVERLLNEVSDKGRFIDALRHAEIFLNLVSKRKLFTMKQEEHFSTILNKYARGECDKDNALKNLMSVVAFPVLLKLSRNENEEFYNFDDQQNSIGLLLIKDLEKCWPRQDEIIIDLVKWLPTGDSIENSIRDEVKKMLSESMPLMPEFPYAIEQQIDVPN